jgi:hypothetical protein
MDSNQQLNNNTKLLKKILDLLSIKNKQEGWNSEKYTYDDYEISKSSVQYLLPIDYTNNFTSFDENNDTESSEPLITHLSTPVLYLCFMLFIYASVILIVLISAIYSHRKRNGYSYEDDDLEEELSELSSYESSSEEHLPTLPNQSSVKYTKLVTENIDDYNKPTNETNTIIISKDLNKLDKNKKKIDKIKNIQMKKIKNQLKHHLAHSKYDLNDKINLIKYFSMYNKIFKPFKKSNGYFKKLIKSSKMSSNSTRFKTSEQTVKIDDLNELTIHNSMDII